MILALPQNIFSAIFYSKLPDADIIFRPSSLILKDIINNEVQVGLIPTLDLIGKEDVVISNKIGIAFDANLSNSYFYFKQNERNIDSIYLRGDISKNEIILAKIILREKYNFEPEFILDSTDINFAEKNYLIAGQENYKYLLKQNSISFSDQIAEFIDFPYVNYILASKEKALLQSLENSLELLDEYAEKNLEQIFSKAKMNADLFPFFSENIDSVYFSLTSNEIDGLMELLKLPYYHGIIEDIIEPKFA